MAEERPPDDDRPPAPRRRRRDRDDDDDGPRAKSGGLGTVAIVLGVLALVMCVCGGPIAIALTLPAVAKVREAAARMTSSNNLKQIGLGAYNQSNAGDMPDALQGPFAVGLGGPATGHSFRVGLLPYIEQGNLYRQIDLTQPWNSLKNAPATGVSIKTYLDPGNPASLGTATPYRMFVGPGAMFDGTGKPVKFADLRDGPSNTIMAISATQTVPWASPQELPYGPGVPLPLLGASPRAGGFLAGFADGSVRFVRSTIPEADLRSLIEKADGRGAGLE